MPSWNELVNEFDAQPTDDLKSQWLKQRLSAELQAVSRLRNNRNVILYGSAFLQKPTAPAPMLQLTQEEINGLMSVMFGMDWKKGLTLILHTPGGITNAAESVVAYLRSKFEYIETIVPTFAMSAGTMIALGTNHIVMGRQSQLGPIDPQLPIGGRFVSARAVVDQFEQGKKEIMDDLKAAHVWAPIMQSLGPSLLREADNALRYGEDMVSRWLRDYMFAGKDDAANKAAAVASHFNDASTHKSHGRRIDRAEATSKGLSIEKLETSQELQEHVLSAYHVMSILFDKSPASKILWTNNGRAWMKNLPHLMVAGPPQRP